MTGLCQTVAFAHRTRAEESKPTQTAEGQPAR